MKKIIAILIVALFIGVAIPSVSAGFATEKAGNTSTTPLPTGNWKGFHVEVKDKYLNPIDGARVRFITYFKLIPWLPAGIASYSTDEDGVVDTTTGSLISLWKVGVTVKITVTHSDCHKYITTHTILEEDGNPIDMPIILRYKS